MMAEIKLKDELLERLQKSSNETGMNLMDLANDVIDKYLDSYIEDRIFEERTRKALENVESNPNRHKMSKDEFFKELETW